MRILRFLSLMLICMAVATLAAGPASAQGYGRGKVYSLTLSTTWASMESLTALSSGSSWTLFPNANVIYCGGKDATSAGANAWSLCTGACNVTGPVTVNMAGSIFGCVAASGTPTLIVHGGGV